MARHTQLTRSDMLRDPLVRQMMRADGVTVDDLARLMADVASRLAAMPRDSDPQGGRSAGKARRNEQKHSRNLPAT